MTRDEREPQFKTELEANARLITAAPDILLDRMGDVPR